MLRTFATKNSSPEISLALSLGVGTVSGAIGALCGVGGGLVMIPAFKAFSKLTMQQITATSMFALTLSSSSGAATYLQEGAANPPTCAALVATASLTSVVGARFGLMLSSKAISAGFAVLMLGALPSVMSKTRLWQSYFPPLVEPAEAKPLQRRHTTSTADAFGHVQESLSSGDPARVLADARHFASEHRTHLLTGLVSGFLSGLFGIGGGLVMTSMLSTTMPQHEAVATAICAVVPTGLVTTAANAVAGNVSFTAGGAAGIGGAVAMALTAKYVAPNVEEEYMRYAFCALLAVSLVKMVL